MADAAVAAPPAGGSGAAPAAAPSGGGGVPAPKGGAPISPSGGGQGGGLPSGVASGPTYLEREVKRGDKMVKEKITHEAAWNAYGREKAFNQKSQELIERERKAQELEQRIAQAQQGLTAKSVRDVIRERKGDQIAELSTALREAIEEEKKSQDPQQRALLEKAGQVEKLQSELNGIRSKEVREQVRQTAIRELERMSAEFMPALDAVKLPKNDITMELMSRASETAKQLGYQLSSEQLARETHKMFESMIESTLEGHVNPEDVLEAFPKLTRKIHEALLLRHQRVSGQPKPATQVAPTEPGTRPPSKQGEEKGPRLMNSAEEHKAYGIRGLRSV